VSATRAPRRRHGSRPRSWPRAVAAAGAVVVLAGCGSRVDPPPPTPAPTSEDTDDRGPTRPPPATPGPPADAPAPADPADPSDPDEPAPTPPDDTDAVAVPDEIAELFTLPTQVRVDAAGTSEAGASDVVQLTGTYVGGGLADAADAFDRALAEAGLQPAREPSNDGVVYVVQLERRTLAIALLLDQGEVAVSVDLLVDRSA
jgi:hypothetical protein